MIKMRDWKCLSCGLITQSQLGPDKCVRCKSTGPFDLASSGLPELPVTPNVETELKEVEAISRDIGRVIQHELPKDIGYALLLFHMGEGGTMTYISNARRADMIKALRELIENLEGGVS